MAADTYALGPTADPLRFTWAPTALLLTPAGTLQGGAGLGAALAAMQTATERPVVWATAQYLSYAPGTDPLDIAVTVEVAGHNTSQARAVVSRHGEEILTAHGALGARSFEFEGVWAVRPEVTAPDSCEPYRFFARGQGNMGDFAEFRLAHGQQLDDVVALGGRGDGRLALWIRCWSGEHAVTVSDLAFIGDFMPMAFAQAIRGPYAGNSLDNTIRVGQLTTTGWVLMAAQVQQIANGFGYGRAELWADDGTMLGEVSQSVVLRKHGHLRMPPDQRG